MWQGWKNYLHKHLVQLSYYYYTLKGQALENHWHKSFCMIVVQMWNGGKFYKEKGNT